MWSALGCLRGVECLRDALGMWSALGCLRDVECLRVP